MVKQRLRKGVRVGVVTFCVFTALFFAIPLKDRGGSPNPTGPLGPREPETSDRSSGVQPGIVVANDDDTVTGTPWRTDKAPLVATLSFPKASKASKRPAAEKSFVTINSKTYPQRTYQMLALPNDPQASQWWVSSSALDAAWSVTAGPYQTVLAIIDTGFALTHEEFTDRWYQNTGEVGTATTESPSKLNCTDRSLALNYSCNLVDDDVDGIVDNESGVALYENPSQLNCSARSLVLDKSCNLIDDDGNGYADDTRGWDMINQDSSVQAGQLSPSGSGTTHGTMVAGVAAATGNNGKGIAGVNWNTKILPIQALDDDGYGNTKSVGDAIFYAVNRGVDVINISLGTEFHDDYVREAVEAATAAGITVVASSGNDGCECVVYPARYPEVVAVGALSTDGTLASFSSWGSSVDIAAPGASMTLPSWSSVNPQTRYVSGAAGTSFSSPLVAGAVALIKSHRPDATPLHLIAALHETADRRHNTPVQQPNTRYGFGMADVAALQNRMTTPKHSALSYVLTPVAVGDQSGAAYEVVGDYRVHDCMEARTGLPLYELKKTSDTFFSISEVEARKAVQSGYTNTRFAYVCLGQPHDTVDAIRPINIHREFRNLTTKY